MTRKPYKPTICLDFDGVLHSYSSNWVSVSVIPDPPVEGAQEFCKKMIEGGWTVAVYSTRCRFPEGLEAVCDWLEKYNFPKEVKVYDFKPAAIIYIDDRGYRFNGSFEELEKFLSDESLLQPWNAQQ